MGPTTKKRLRRAAIAAGVVVGTPAALVAFLHTDAGQELVRARLERALNERFDGGSTKVGGVRLSLRSGVAVTGVVVRDASGAEAVRVGQVVAEPRWGQLWSGRPTLARLEVRDVQVEVRQNDDGTSNLSTLRKPRPPAPPKPERPIEYVAIEALTVSGVGLVLIKPDGTRVSVEGVGLGGHVVARPVRRGLDLKLDTVTLASVGVRRPDGLDASIRDLRWGGSARLDQGAGPVTLDPLSAELTLKLPQATTPQSSRLALGGAQIELGEGSLAVAAKALGAAALAVEAIDVSGKAKHGALEGEQAAKVVGLRVDHKKLHELLGKNILADDVVVGVGLGGPPERLGVDLDLGSAGQRASLRGTLDAHDRLSLGYDLTLRSARLALPELLATEAPPQVELRELSVAVKGQGITRLDAAFDVGLVVGPLLVRGTQLDRVELDARFERGELTVRRLHVEAFDQRVDINGKVRLGDKYVSAELRTQGALGPTLARLRQAGVKIPPSPALAALSLDQGVYARVEGTLDGGLRIELPDVRARFAGATARVRATAELVPGDPDKGEKRLRPRAIDADLEVHGLSIERLAALRGKKAPVSGTLSGKVHLGGAADAPEARFDLHGDVAADGGRPAPVALRGTASRGRVRARAEVGDDKQAPLLRADLDVPLAGRALNPRAPLAIKLDVPSRPIAQLASLLPASVRQRARLPDDGLAELHVDLRGTAEHPEGTLSLVASGGLLPGGPQRVRLDADVSSPSGHVDVGLRLAAALRPGDPQLSAKGSVRFERSPVVVRATPLTWEAEIDAADELASLPLPPERRGLAGSVKAHVSARGSRDDLEGKVTLSGRGVRRGGPPADVDLELTLSPQSTRITAGAKLAGLEALALRGEVGLGGKGLYAALKARPDPSVALDIEVPQHTLAEWGAVLDPLHDLPGTFGGKIELRGRARSPRLDGALTYAGYRTLSGKTGQLALGLSGGVLDARLSLSTPSNLALEASFSPALFAAARTNDTPLPVRSFARLRSDTPLADLVPDAPQLRELGLAGTLRGDLGVDVQLDVSKTAVTPARASFSGSLALDDGSLAVPASSRTLRQIALKLRGDGDALVVEQLSARESDLEKPDRSLEASGRLAFEGVRPRRLEARLKAADFLLFGGNFGRPDAPRASLTADLAVAADLGPDARSVTVDVHSLTLWSPDRFARAHQQEVVSTGDLIELGQGVAVGKLPTPKPAPTPDPTPPGSIKPLIVRVRLPHPVRLKQIPMDIEAQGEVLVTRSSSGERSVSGTLAVVGGRFLLGGKMHDIDRGEIRFTDRGSPYLDLWFKRQAHPAALRDFATDQETSVRVHLAGELGKQKVAVSGLSDSLFESLSLLNLGRVRYLSRPDLPASQTPQLPQFGNIRQSSYMSANLPHLLFLDRFGAQAEPRDSPTSYGRLTRLEAERYSADGKRRLRVQTRPPTVGLSQAEVEFDLLFSNSPRSVSGIGLVGGSRGGGGPTLFWEWSSSPRSAGF